MWLSIHFRRVTASSAAACKIQAKKCCIDPIRDTRRNRQKVDCTTTSQSHNFDCLPEVVGPAHSEIHLCMQYYLVEKHVKHSLFIWIFFGWPVTHLMSQLIVLLVFNTLIPLMILCSVHLTSQCDVIMHVIIAIRPDTFYSSFLIPYSIYIKQEMGLKKIPVDYMCGGIELVLKVAILGRHWTRLGAENGSSTLCPHNIISGIMCYNVKCHKLHKWDLWYQTLLRILHPIVCVTVYVCQWVRL